MTARANGLGEKRTQANQHERRHLWLSSGEIGLKLIGLERKTVVLLVVVLVGVELVSHISLHSSPSITIANCTKNNTLAFNRDVRALVASRNPTDISPALVKLANLYICTIKDKGNPKQAHLEPRTTLLNIKRFVLR